MIILARCQIILANWRKEDNVPSKWSQTTSPVLGEIATIPILTFSSVPMPPRSSSTRQTRGATEVGSMSSAEPRWSTYVAAVYKPVNCRENSSFRVSLTFLRAAVSVCPMIPTLYPWESSLQRWNEQSESQSSLTQGKWKLTFSSELPDGAQELKQSKSSSFGMPLFQVVLLLSGHHEMSVKSVICHIWTYWCIIPKETIFVSNLKHQEGHWIFAF